MDDFLIRRAVLMSEWSLSIKQLIRGGAAAGNDEFVSLSYACKEWDRVTVSGQNRKKTNWKSKSQQECKVRLQWVRKVD